jgi:hypothetical protein
VARAGGAAVTGNIGPRERRRRLVFGLVMLVIGFGGLATLLVLQVDLAWRAVLFLPFWLAALGYFQSRAST